MVEYRVSTIMHFTLLFMCLFALSVFFISMYMIPFGMSLSNILLLFCVSMCLLGCFICIRGICKGFGKTHVIKVDNGKFYFYEGVFSKERLIADMSEISSAAVSDRRYGKLLRMTISGKQYVIDNTLLSEQNFSRLCNFFVKHSGRCKACQSGNVVIENIRILKGECDVERLNSPQVRCYNCETISPFLADDFNWNDAYQAKLKF